MPGPAGTPDQERPQPLWRNRDFTLLWSGQVISTLGARISTLAYPLLVLAETGSPARAGLVGFAQHLPFLLVFLPAGALVDRWDRKRVMLVSDAGRALALGSIAVAVALDQVSLAHIAAVAFVDGCLQIFFQLAESAALPHVVRPHQLSTALAQNQARDQGADLAGQPLGGLLFGISPLLPFAADAVSYSVSFVTLLFIRGPLQERRQEPVAGTRRLLAEIAEGVTWLWRQRLLRALVIVIGASNLVSNVLPLVLIVRAQQLGASAPAIGVMFACYGAGAIAGAIAAPWLRRRIPTPVILLGALWLWATLGVGMVLTPNVLALGVLLALGAFFGPLFNVVVAEYRYALCPDRLLARTHSAARMIAWGTIPLGSLAAGFLLEAVGPVRSLVAVAFGAGLTAAAATAVPVIRRAPRVQDLTATGAEPGPGTDPETDRTARESRS